MYNEKPGFNFCQCMYPNPRGPRTQIWNQALSTNGCGLKTKNRQKYFSLFLLPPFLFSIFPLFLSLSYISGSSWLFKMQNELLFKNISAIIKKPICCLKTDIRVQIIPNFLPTNFKILLITAKQKS